LHQSNSSSLELARKLDRIEEKKREMANGKWQMANGKWQMANGTQ